MNKKYVSFIMNGLIFVFECIACTMSFLKHGFGMVEYFTVDSNLLALGCSFFFLIYQIKGMKKEEALPQWLLIWKYISVCCLTLTFLVVIFVLIPLQGGTKAIVPFLFSGEMLYHHFLCPILAFVSYLWFEASTLTKKDVIAGVIPAGCYAIILIVLNILKVVEGPYPFLKVYQQPIYMSVVWCIAILGFAFVIAKIIANKKIQKSENV